MLNVGDPDYQGVDDEALTKFPEFLNQPFMRDALHVGNLTFGPGDIVGYYLQLDYPQSTRSKLETLLDSSYKVGSVQILCGFDSGLQVEIKSCLLTFL
jgi:hypothetical protein